MFVCDPSQWDVELYRVAIHPFTVVLEESPCPRGTIYKSLSSDLKSLSSDYRVLENYQRLHILQKVVMYDHVTSINSVTATMHEDTV